MKRYCFSQRGELRDHVLSIIIGIVALGLMLYAAWILMQSYMTSDYDKAVDALQTIERKLNTLDEGAYTRFPLQGPEGWYLQGWSAQEAGRPDRCYFKSCVCICKDRGALSCQDSLSGTCKLINEKELFVGSEAILLSAVSANTGGNVPASPTPTRSDAPERCPSIVFEKNLLEIELVRKSDRVEVVYHSSTPIQKEGCWR